MVESSALEKSIEEIFYEAADLMNNKHHQMEPYISKLKQEMCFNETLLREVTNEQLN